MYYLTNTLRQIKIYDMNEKLINVKGITFSYGRKKANVFEDFSMSLNRGAVYGLLGKNGTGKSTLLYLMCGLLRPKAGQVLMNGIDVKLRLPQTLRDTFLVPEEFSFPNLPLKQFVKLNAPFYPNFSDEILHRCLADFDMDTDIHLNELSMGQKKKAYMCFALATNTPLLIMDEPTNGFDIPSKSQMRKVIASSMTDEKTIVISTHQVRDVENLLDHVLMIDNNRLMLDAAFSTLAERLYFTELPLNEPADDALFVQPSLQGKSAIFRNRAGEESTINLELLFNAMLAEGDKIKEALK